jgi:hypothetical protein
MRSVPVRAGHERGPNRLEVAGEQFHRVGTNIYPMKHLSEENFRSCAILRSTGRSKSMRLVSCERGEQKPDDGSQRTFHSQFRSVRHFMQPRHALQAQLANARYWKRTQSLKRRAIEDGASLRPCRLASFITLFGRTMQLKAIRRGLRDDQLFHYQQAGAAILRWHKLAKVRKMPIPTSMPFVAGFRLQTGEPLLQVRQRLGLSCILGGCDHRRSPRALSLDVRFARAAEKLAPTLPIGVVFREIAVRAQLGKDADVHAGILLDWKIDVNAGDEFPLTTDAHQSSLRAESGDRAKSVRITVNQRSVIL